MSAATPMMERSLSEVFGPPPKRQIATPAVTMSTLPPRPTRTLVLSSSRGQTTVTLTQKYGVWFVTAAAAAAAAGALRLYDLLQFGDCEPDLARAARHLHFTISPSSTTAFTPQKVFANPSQRPERQPARTNPVPLPEPQRLHALGTPDAHPVLATPRLNNEDLPLPGSTRIAPMNAPVTTVEHRQALNPASRY